MPPPEPGKGYQWSNSPEAHGIRNFGTKYLEVGDESELEARRRGDAPPLNPDGTPPAGWELY